MIIQLPFVPVYPGQGESVVDILKKLPSYVTPGVQVYRGPVDLHRQMTEGDLERYINRIIPKDFVITLHAQISDNVADRRYRLDCPESKDYVRANILLAEAVGARSVTIHPNTVFHQGSGELAWTEDMDDYETMHRRVREPMFRILNNLAGGSDMVLGIENMPLPIRGDKIADPSMIFYEPSMNSYEDIIEYCDRTLPKLKLTYDTAHAEISRRVVERLRSENVDTPEKLRKTPYRGVYPGKLGKQPAVRDVLCELLERGKVADVQLNDTDGEWVPNKSLLSEGCDLGEGYLGDHIFEMAQLIADKYPDIPVSVDAKEDDYISRPNQVRAIRRLLDTVR